MSIRNPIPWLALSLVLGACAAPVRGPVVLELLDDAVARAAFEREAGRELSADLLVDMARRVDPAHPGLAELGETSTEASDLLDAGYLRPSRLGPRVNERRETEASVGEHVLWYIPDRILDVFDIYSFGVGFGVPFFWDWHVTRGFGWSFGAEVSGQLGWFPGRQLGVEARTTVGGAFFPAGWLHRRARSFGTAGARHTENTMLFLRAPWQETYQDDVSYWDYGQRITFLVSLSEDVHLMEIVDFVGGLLLFDPLNDDLADTEPFLEARPGPDVRRIVRSLHWVTDDPRAVADYREFKANLPPQAPTAEEPTAEEPVDGAAADEGAPQDDGVSASGAVEFDDPR